MADWGCWMAAGALLEIDKFCEKSGSVSGVE